MIKIQNVTIKNFLSVGNATQAIRLDANGLTLILGANTDGNGGTTRNGAGKSTILQAISFGLFGKPLTKIKVDNLVNNINNKGMIVTVEFEKDGKSYRIERGRKPQILRWFVNNQEHKDDKGSDEAQGENKHTQDEIERVLGMTHTMFLHVLALNTFTDPFLKMKAADQRAVIEELLGVVTLSQRADALKKLVAQTKERVRDEEATIKATTEANARIEGMIRQTETSQQRWQRQHEATLAELLESIEAVEKIDFDAEIAQFDALDLFLAGQRDAKAAWEKAKYTLDTQHREVNRALDALGKAETALTGSDVEAAVKRLERDNQRKMDDSRRHIANADKLSEDIEKLKGQIARADATTCQCCDQPLTGTDHLATVIANFERQIEQAAAKKARELADAKARMDEGMAALDEVAVVRADAQARQEAATQALADAERQHEDAHRAHDAALAEEKAARAALAALGDRPQTTFGSRDEVYKAKQLYETLARDLENETAQVNPFDAQVEGLRGTVQPIDNQPLIDLQDLQKHQDLLLKLLTNKDSFIRKKIVDQNLNYLNTRLNHYLDKLGLPHEVQFQPDLSVDIRHLGRDFDFEQLSRGEMNRVIMATSWSFRDVWESLNEPVNLYFIDEVLDQGTDSHGAEAALAILKSMARDRGKNVFLISHRDELVGRIDRTLLVRKEQGFSQFEEDAL